MPVIMHIDGLAAGGEGIARLEGKAIFVIGAVPGDTVEAELIDQRGRSARARIVRIVTPSRGRVDPGCPHARECGGCPWLHMSYDTQRVAKEAIFREALRRLGGVNTESLETHTLIASPAALGYRRRAKLHLSGQRLGYRAAASHELVEIGECRQLDPRLEAAVARLRAALEREKAPAGCTDVALACDDHRVTAAFFVARAHASTRERVERLLGAAKLDGGVVVPEGGRGSPMGKALLSFAAPHAAGVTLHGRADLFAQASSLGNGLLVAEAMRLLGGGESGPRLLELYAGAGNFTFAASRRGFSVTAIENDAGSVELAQMSAREARIASLRFIQGDALKVAGALACEGKRFDALLLDPPRSGAQGLGEIARHTEVNRIVYISCDPATLARDVGELQRSGFRPVEATPVDMFPQTFHVEGVVLLVRDR